MLTLGFTNHFYTLWSVTNSIRQGAGMVMNGVFTGESWSVTHYTYHQNLSMDYEAAKEKITLMAGEGMWAEDLELRGSGSFERTVRQINAMADWQFTFGKLTGNDIRKSDDLWQLKRAMNEEPKGRTRVIARRRLIELGELIRYDWIERAFDQNLCDKYWRENGNIITNENNPTYDMFCVDKRRKYATPKHAAIMEQKKAEAAMNGHFYTDKEKIEIKIKQVGSFSFETAYGTTFICKYIDENGRMFKYMGSTPPEVSEEDFVTVKATVKHDSYKDKPETKLQRIKIK